jgi:hypothetical protein
MEDRRKITVVVYSDLLARAQKASRAGVSETVRRGLELLAANEVYDSLLKMRGKEKSSVALSDLREDRRY